MTDHERRLIELLGSIHRGWRYEARDLPGLPRCRATRYQSVAPTRHRARARDVVARSTIHRLAQALGHQDETVHLIRR